MVRLITLGEPGSEIDLRGKRAPRRYANTRIRGFRKVRPDIEDQHRAVRGNLACHEPAPGSCATNDYIVGVRHESPSLLLVEPSEAPLFKNPDLHLGPPRVIHNPAPAT